MERFFNTAGPNIVEDNYTIDPLSRFDLDDILTLIRQKRYFVLHAPRQTGKTSCLLALRDYINQEGRYIAVYAIIYLLRRLTHSDKLYHNNCEKTIFEGKCKNMLLFRRGPSGRHIFRGQSTEKLVLPFYLRYTYSITNPRFFCGSGV